MKRRTFIKKTATGTAGIAMPAYLTSFAKERRLRIGVIGTGWFGLLLGELAIGTGKAEIVAVCDVDNERLKGSTEKLEQLQGARPATFRDYWDMLDMKELEAVFIATPTHWHALQFIDACHKGLDIYCEKPLSYDIMEGLAMVRAAQKAGNIVQIGFMRLQGEPYQYVRQLIEEGKAGNINQIVAQIHFRANPGDTTIQDPPESLDWDLWCGPAPKLPYSRGAHYSWRQQKVYGNGHMVDWGIHHIHTARKIMEDVIAEKYTATGGVYFLKNRITAPDTLTANISFKKVPLIWQHRMWGAGDMNPELNDGIFFHGDKASIFVSDNRVMVRPANEDAELTDRIFGDRMDVIMDMIKLHVDEFITASLLRDPSTISCPIQDAYSSTTTVHLAAMAYETGSTVKWDNQRSTIINNSQAEALMKRQYRDGWKHPG